MAKMPKKKIFTKFSSLAAPAPTNFPDIPKFGMNGLNFTMIGK